MLLYKEESFCSKRMTATHTDIFYKSILLMISIVIFYYCAAYGYTNFAEQSYPLTP